MLRFVSSCLLEFHIEIVITLMILFEAFAFK